MHAAWDVPHCEQCFSWHASMKSSTLRSLEQLHVPPAPFGVNLMRSQVLYWAAQVAQHSTYLPCCQAAETIDTVYSATCNVPHLGPQWAGTVVVCCSVQKEVRLQHAIFPDCSYRLASTCWANAQLEVVPRFSTNLGANMQDHNLDSCFDGCHQTQSGHMNTAIVMPGGSVSQTGLM